MLSDKIGRVNAFIFAYIIYFLALLVILLTTDSIFYILGMSLVRLGVNTIAMTGRSVVSTAKRDRALKNGLLSSMVGFGSFLGPFALGYILDHYPPDVMIYATFGLIAIDMLSFFFIYGYINRYFDSNDLQRDLSYNPIEKNRFESYREALNTEGVKEIFFLFFATGFVYGSITQIYAIYGYNVLFLSITFIGLITGLSSLVQTFWAPIVGRLYEVIKDEYLRVFAWLLITLGAICSVLSKFSVGFFILTIVLLNFGNSTYSTVEITRMSKLVKSQFSLIFGIATSLIILATSITGFISLALYEFFPEASFYVAAVVAVFGLFVVLLFTPRIKRTRGETTNYPVTIDL